MGNLIDSECNREQTVAPICPRRAIVIPDQPQKS